MYVYALWIPFGCALVTESYNHLNWKGPSKDIYSSSPNVLLIKAVSSHIIFRCIFASGYLGLKDNLLILQMLMVTSSPWDWHLRKHDIEESPE